MRRFLPILLLTVLPPCGRAQQALDTYGGVMALRCPTDTAEWKMEQIVGGGRTQWVFCTPTNGNTSGHSHAFIKKGVWFMTGSGSTEANHVPVSWNTTTAAKYSSNNVRDNFEYARIIGWGFNSGAPGALRHATDSFITNKVPFSEGDSGIPSTNTWQHCINLGGCINLWDLTTAAYSNNTNRNLVDAYGTAYANWVPTEYAADSVLAGYLASPYFIGWVPGDTDFASGFSGARPIAPNHPWDTDPGCPANCGASSAWSTPMLQIAASAPRLMTTPRQSNAVLSDPINHTKIQFCNFLQTEYTTAAAWNAAWGTGSFYTGFGTDGTQVTGAATSGSGSGPYTATLHVNVDNFSVLVLVNGVGQAGDSQGHGTISGINISSATINYATGAISITFTGTPAAPPTVNYYWGGWGTGHQCLDENGTHIGNGDNTGAPGATAGQITAQVTDMDNFLVQYTNKWLSVMKNAFTGLGTTKLFFGLSNMGQVPGRDPSRCPELTGAGQVNDVTLVSTDGSQAQMDFIALCLGDKPFANWETVSAEADSDWYDCPSGTGCSSSPGPWPPANWNLSNQNTRGTFYQTDMTNFWTHCHSTNGICSWVGFDWWAYTEQSFFERFNDGLITWRDNAYDGVEDVTASVSCSSPIASLTCGGEQAGWSVYGNFLGPVTAANRQLDTDLANLANGPNNSTFFAKAATEHK